MNEITRKKTHTKKCVKCGVKNLHWEKVNKNGHVKLHDDDGVLHVCSSRRCRECGAVGFNWKEIDGANKLVDSNDVIHDCTPKWKLNS